MPMDALTPDGLVADVAEAAAATTPPCDCRPDTADAVAALDSAAMEPKYACDPEGPADVVAVAAAAARPTLVCFPAGGDALVAVLALDTTPVSPVDAAAPNSVPGTRRSMSNRQGLAVAKRIAAPDSALSANAISG